MFHFRNFSNILNKKWNEAFDHKIIERVKFIKK